MMIDTGLPPRCGFLSIFHSDEIQKIPLSTLNMEDFEISFLKYFVPGSIVNDCYDERDDVTENDELMTGDDC